MIRKNSSFSLALFSTLILQYLALLFFMDYYFKGLEDTIKGYFSLFLPRAILLVILAVVALVTLLKKWKISQIFLLGFLVVYQIKVFSLTTGRVPLGMSLLILVVALSQGCLIFFWRDFFKRYSS